MASSQRSSAPLDGTSRSGSARLAHWAFTAILGYYLVATVTLAVGANSGHSYYDERFNLAVVGQYFQGASGPPVNHWYSPLSWAPQLVLLKAADRLAAATGAEMVPVFDPESGTVTRRGLLLCRLLNVAYAAVALVLLFRLASRLATPRVGAWSALVFVGSPWAIRCAVEFKPDALLLLTTMLCAGWALPLVRGDDWRHFARAGLASGLMVTAKLNGALAAPAVALAVLAGGVSRRRLVRAAAALGIAAATFLLTQPWLGQALGFLGRIRRHYLGHERRLSFAEMAALPWRALLEPTYLGSLLGGVALVGLALLAVHAAREWRAKAAAREWAVVVSWPAAFVLGTAVLTRYPKSNLWIPLLPFAAIAAGWTIGGALDHLAGLGGRPGAEPTGRRRPAAVASGLIGATVVALALGQSAVYVYESVVPRTGDALVRGARRALEPGQLVAAVDPSGGPLPRLSWEPTRELRERVELRGTRAFAPVVRFARLQVQPDGGAPELELFDAELFALDRLDAASRTALERRLRRGPRGLVRRFEPEWFRRWGESWLLVVRPWRAEGPPACVPLAGAAVDLPRPAAGEPEVVATVTLQVASARREATPRLRFGERELRLLDAGVDFESAKPMRMWTSQRFRWRDEPARVVAPAAGFAPGALGCVRLWRPPETPAP
jgi:hypothetical protein